VIWSEWHWVESVCVMCIYVLFDLNFFVPC
jgi:hypothetical protein